MKNIIKNPIFTFIIGIVIASSSVVIAATLISSQVGKDTTWNVNRNGNFNNDTVSNATNNGVRPASFKTTFYNTKVYKY